MLAISIFSFSQQCFLPIQEVMLSLELPPVNSCNQFMVKKKVCMLMTIINFMLFFIGLFFIPPRGEKWANPGGTAIPGRPVARAEQAPDISPQSKNQFNIEVPLWGTYQILS